MREPTERRLRLGIRKLEPKRRPRGPSTRMLGLRKTTREPSPRAQQVGVGAQEDQAEPHIRRASTMRCWEPEKSAPRPQKRIPTQAGVQVVEGAQTKLVAGPSLGPQIHGDNPGPQEVALVDQQQRRKSTAVASDVGRGANNIKCDGSNASRLLAASLLRVIAPE
mmetsp:Transcript_69685/g.185662  ORF Transcript_69685/g.185662 Transcript_69685/m.185662 type:complete len:165 (+) Transcript_69685:359-853(+)